LFELELVYEDILVVGETHFQGLGLPPSEVLDVPRDLPLLHIAVCYLLVLVLRTFLHWLLRIILGNCMVASHRLGGSGEPLGGHFIQRLHVSDV